MQVIFRLEVGRFVRILVQISLMQRGLLRKSLPYGIESGILHRSTRLLLVFKAVL